MNYLFFVRFGLLLGSLLVGSLSYGAELTHEQAAIIYQKAIAATRDKYQMPEVAPQIHIVDNLKLRQMYCTEMVKEDCDVCAPVPKIDEDCVAHKETLRGITNEDGVIYLDNQLDFSNAYEASVLFHEFVHALQYYNLGPFTECRDWANREYEAYQLQVYELNKERMIPFSLLRQIQSQANYYKHYPCDGQ